MSTASLESFISTGSTAGIYFFNGRLLSGGDLSVEGLAHRRRQQRVALGLGAGVARGLKVSLNTALSTTSLPVLTVGSGLAFDALGHALELEAPIDVQLRRSVGAASSVTSVFQDCAPAEQGAALTADAVYLLVMSPGEEKHGRAQVCGLGNATAACNAHELIEGVSFRLVELFASNSGIPFDARLRNRVAWQCLGTNDAALTAFSKAPFSGSPPSDYGRLAVLRAGNRLTNCDVPLAALRWNSAGVDWVDHWSVRRRPSPALDEVRWPHLLNARRRAEAEAAFFEFQEHIDALVAEGVDRAAPARERFEFLPAGGLLPVASTGFSVESFFAGFPLDASMTSIACLNALVAESLQLGPIPVSPAGTSLIPAPEIKIFGFIDASDIVFFLRSDLSTRMDRDTALRSRRDAKEGSPRKPKGVIK